MADDGRIRCGWAGSDPLYIAYHDAEWGVPLHDDRRLFEMLVLEGFQAGLSWITILRKRENLPQSVRSLRCRTRSRGYGPARSRRCSPIPASCATGLKIEGADPLGARLSST